VSTIDLDTPLGKIKLTTQQGWVNSLMQSIPNTSREPCGKSSSATATD
jgi:hypothetical protein